jgi:pimeloyl-ACP methyl ester carboxylesterase
MTTSSALRGLGRLAVSATLGITDLVEAMHAEIARLPLRASRERTGGLTGLVYGSVRGVTKLVGAGLDPALAALQPLLAQELPDRALAVQAALNGILGDRLEASANPLVLPMSLHPLVDAAEGPPVLLLHGLCMNERQWRRATPPQGVDLPAALAALGYRPLGLRYNSGRAIWRNGAELAALLDTVPGPLTVVGHSMGGLVIRSALAQAEGRRWPKRLKRLVTLGTPHQGAPLERGGQQIEQLLALSAYSRPLARLAGRRSAGIRDLRHGSLLEADAGRASRLPLPAGVACYAIAATTSKSAARLGSQWLGDGLVPVASALGQHREAARRLAFTDTALVTGLGHLALQTDPRVLEHLRAWLQPLP